jgi:hypothetical protein
VLLRGRAIGWIEDALASLHETHPHLDVRRLAVAIRSATGIEALIWLTDIAGLTRQDAPELMRWSARAMLHAALAEATQISSGPVTRECGVRANHTLTVACWPGCCCSRLRINQMEAGALLA